jgi:mono/diheme cytochrome c family protein
MNTISRTVIIRILVLALFACTAARAFAAQSGEDSRSLFRQGARLWPVYCAQCHNARPGSDFSPVQWDAIMMHMRTQGNLPAEEARAILEYLKNSR